MNKAPLHQIADELWKKESVYLDTEKGDSLVACIEQNRLRLVELVIKPDPGKNVPPIGFVQFFHRGKGEYEILGQGFKYKHITNGINYGIGVVPQAKERGIGRALMTLGIESVRRFHKEKGHDTPIKIRAEATERSMEFYRKYGFNVERKISDYRDMESIIATLEEPIPLKSIYIK